MASSNLDLVRFIYAAGERGDYSSAEWAHPDIEFAIADGPSPGRWTGLAGLAEGYRGVVDVWQEFRSHVDEYRELDDERVLVLSNFSGRGKASGLQLGHTQTKGAQLFHLRNGRIVLCWDRGRALADLGLSSESDSTVP